MEEKSLGKITFAEFGQCKDRPFLFGLHLCFEFDGGSSGCCDGGQYAINIGKRCDWSKVESRDILKVMEIINKTLKDAKVSYISELINKPVEVTFEKNRFKNFRILTEVI